MTANELRNKFNDEFGLSPRPGQYFVDAITYANVCNEIFKRHLDNAEYYGNHTQITLSVGLNGGILFKNIELIYDPVEDRK